MRLSDICNVYSGYAFKTFNDLGHGVPVIKISNLLPDGSIDLINCLFTTDNFKEKFYSKKEEKIFFKNRKKSLTNTCVSNIV